MGRQAGHLHLTCHKRGGWSETRMRCSPEPPETLWPRGSGLGIREAKTRPYQKGWQRPPFSALPPGGVGSSPQPPPGVSHLPLALPLARRGPSLSLGTRAAHCPALPPCHSLAPLTSNTKANRFPWVLSPRAVYFPL